MIINEQKSFATLVTVLVVGAVGIAIATTLILASTDYYRSSGSTTEALQAKSFADACGEKALQAIYDDTNYSGNQTFDMRQDFYSTAPSPVPSPLIIPAQTMSCTILPVTNAGSQTPTVKVEGRSGRSVKRLIIDISQIDPTIKLSSWKEVADF